MSQNTRIQGKWQGYWLEDIQCIDCLHYRNRGGNGCGRTTCRYEAEKRDAIAHGRIRRKRRRGKWQETQ